MDPPAAGCGAGCASTFDCPAGLYCDETDMCTAMCSVATGTGCGPGSRCSSDGHCVPASGDGPDDNLCADILLMGDPVTPTVVMIIDQSGSMDAAFGGSGTRWDVLRDSLLAQPDGFIFDLQSQVRFGLALYSSRSNSAGTMIVGECPILTQVTPAIDNFDPIDRIYGPADIMDETPTGESIDAVRESVLAAPDRTDDPVIFVVATDGEPDTCARPNPQEGQAVAVASVERSFAAGIRTFMIFVGEDVPSQTHMQDMANAGIGRVPADPQAEFWPVGNDAGLRDALRTIIGGVLSCDVTLRGQIDPAQACTGTVTLNGRVLSCDDPDGWRAIDSNHIRLMGAACDELTTSNNATLVGRFPCDVVIL